MSEGGKKAPVVPAATLVILGAMGDLTSPLLAPALIKLTPDGVVDPPRKPWMPQSTGSGRLLQREWVER